VTYKTSQQDSPVESHWGYLHGTTITYVGHKYATSKYRDPAYVPDWEDFFKYCNVDPTQEYHLTAMCLHGYGHVFHYWSMEELYPVPNIPNYCLPEPPLHDILNISKAYDAQRSCLALGSPSMQRDCAWGIWHGVLEWYFQSTGEEGSSKTINYLKDEEGHEVKDPYWPCSDPKTVTASACFQTTWTYLFFGDWRFDVVADPLHGGFIASCDALPLQQQLGCIYGMSAIMFPLYDKVVAPRTAADLEKKPDHERCGSLWGSNLIGYDIGYGFDGLSTDYYDQMTYKKVPESHCNLLFGIDLHYRPTLPNVLPPKQTPATLVAYCENFAGDAPTGGKLDDLEWRRWKACIAGSFAWVARHIFREQRTPTDTRWRFCPQFLEVGWLGHSQRRHSFDLCYNATMLPDVDYSVKVKDIVVPIDSEIWY